MTKPTGMEEQRSRLDTARILSLPPHLLHSTVIGLVNNFLIHDATDLRWDARTRISGEIGSNQYGQIVAERQSFSNFYDTSAEGVPTLSGIHRLVPRSGDFMSQNGG